MFTAEAGGLVLLVVELRILLLAADPSLRDRSCCAQYFVGMCSPPLLVLYSGTGGVNGEAYAAYPGSLSMHPLATCSFGASYGSMPPR